MILALSALLKFALFLFFAGFPLHVLLTPRFLKGRGLEPWLCVFYGFSLVPLLGAWAFALNFPISYAFYAAFILPCTLLGWLSLYRKEALLAELSALRATFLSWGVFELLTALACGALLLSPLYGAPDAVSPFRFGPDIAQYCGMAQYLLDGGTLHPLGGLWTAVNTGAHVLKQSFLVYFRWGVSFELALAAWLAGQPQEVSKTAFAALFLPYALGAAFAFALLQRHAPPRAAFLLACALALNGNLINVYYESFWGQVCALPALAFVFLLLDELRRAVQDWRDLFAAGVFVFASLLALYSDAALFFIPVFCGAVFALDLFFERRLVRWPLPALACAAGGVLLLLPCFPFLHNNIFQSAGAIGIGGGAWAQPLWAWPSEIFGLTSIYGKPGGPLVYNSPLARGLFDLFLNGVVSVLLCLLFFAHVLRGKKSFYLAPALLTAAAAAFLLARGSHNYLYFKVYTLFLPLLLAGLASAFYESGFARRGKAALRWTLVFFVCAALAGTATVLKYNSQRAFMGPGLCGVHAFVGRDTLVKPSRWDGALFVYLAPPSSSNGAPRLPHPAEHAMFNIMRVNWLNPLALREPGDESPFLPLRTLLLLKRPPEPEKTPRINPPGRLLYENPEYLLFDCGLPLSSFRGTARAPDFSSAFAPY